MRYIEVFYNRWRPHSHNDGLPPATAMARFQTRSSQLPAAAYPEKTNRLSHILDTPQCDQIWLTPKTARLTLK